MLNPNSIKYYFKGITSALSPAVVMLTLDDGETKITGLKSNLSKSEDILKSGIVDKYQFSVTVDKTAYSLPVLNSYVTDADGTEFEVLAIDHSSLGITARIDLG